MGEVEVGAVDPLIITHALGGVTTTVEITVVLVVIEVLTLWPCVTSHLPGVAWP